MMKTLMLKVPENLEKRLARLKKLSGKSIQSHVRAALEQHLQDLEDYQKAVATLEKVESGEMSTRPLAEWKRDYDRRRRLEN